MNQGKNKQAGLGVGRFPGWRLLVATVALAACNSEEESRPKHPMERKMEFSGTPSPDTILIDSNTADQQIIYQGAGELLVPAGSAMAAQIRSGSILLIPQSRSWPTGLLARVEETGTDLTGNLIVYYKPASMEEAYEELHLLVQAGIEGGYEVGGNSQTYSLRTHTERRALTAEASWTLHLKGDPIVLEDLDGNPSTKEDQVLVMVSGSVYTGLVLRVHIDWSGIELETGLRSEIQGRLRVQVGPGLSFSVEKKVWEMAVSAIPVGPIVIVPTITLSVGAEGAVSAPFEAGMDAYLFTEAGARYADGVWEPYSSFERDFKPVVHDLSGIYAELKGYVTVGLPLRLQGILGPSPEVSLYLRAEATPSRWALYGGIDGKVALDVSFVSSKLTGRHEFGLFSGAEWLLTASDENSSSTDAVCGNGIREEDEECDGSDVGALTCADLAFWGSGRPGCDSSCHLDPMWCFKEPIIFATPVSGKWQIQEFTADGAMAELTEDPAYDSLAPRWSRDRSTIAFFRNDGADRSIWLMDAHGGNERLLITEVALQRFLGKGQFHLRPEIVWSADDSYLILVGNDDGANHYSTFLAVDVASGSPRVFHEVGALSGYTAADISPDGTHFVFVRERSCCWAPTSNVYEGDIVDGILDANTIRLFSATDDGQADMSPSYSPDGSTIYFCKSDNAAGHGTPQNVYALDRRTGTQIRLTNLSGFADRPRPSPDGALVLFLLLSDGHADNEGDLRILKLDDRSLISVTDTPDIVERYADW